MIQIEFLNSLYRWKVEAEQELEKLQEPIEHELSVDDAEWVIKIRDLKIRNAEGLVNRYQTAIQSYLIHHNLSR